MLYLAVLLMLATVAGYVLGAIPVGMLVGYFYRRIDVREHGSRRTGATNVLRTLGPGAAAFVAAGDLTKGALAVVIARMVFWGQPAMDLHVAEVMAALAALAGHNWSIFISWKGGRGVLVSAGAVLMLFPPSVIICAVIGLLVIALSRFVSLGSLVGAVLTAVLLLASVTFGIEPRPYAAYAVIGALVIVIQHRDNIERLRAGKERKLGQVEAGER